MGRIFGSCTGDTSKPDINRAAGIFVLTLALIYGGYRVLRSGWGPTQGYDFGQLYVPAKLILTGEPLTMYDTTALYQNKATLFGAVRAPRGKPAESGDRPLQVATTNAYPPVVAYLALPLALFPYNIARNLFSLISVVAGLAAALLLFLHREPSRRAILIITGWAALLLFTPFHLILNLGLPDAILLCLLALALFSVHHKLFWLAGLCVALAIHIKLYPAILLPFFLIRRQYKLLGMSILFSALIAGLIGILGSPQLYLHYFGTILPRQYDAGAYFSNQGFGGFFSRLLTENPYVRSLGDYPDLARLLTALTGLLLIALTLLILWQNRSEPRLIPTYDLEYSLCLTAALIVMPKSYEHMGVILLPAFLFTFENLIYRPGADKRLLILLFISFIIRAFIFLSESDWSKMPNFLLTNPLFSIHLFANLLLWAVIITTLRLKPRAAD